MIVVTGPGRSGTSLVAELYRRCGMDPGGSWSKEVRAGLEDPEIVDLNRRIARDLGVRIPGRQALPGEERLPEGRALHETSRVLDRFTGRFRLFPDTASHQEVADRYRGEILDASRDRAMVKDPRFCWTLSVWLAAGGDIEHVVVCMRALRDVVDSRIGMPLAQTREVETRTALVGVGLLQFALAEHDVPVTTVRYPHSFRRADELRVALPGLEHLGDEFTTAFDEVVDPRLRDQRPRNEP